MRRLSARWERHYRGGWLFGVTAFRGDLVAADGCCTSGSMGYDWLYLHLGPGCLVVKRAHA